MMMTTMMIRIKERRLKLIIVFIRISKTPSRMMTKMLLVNFNRRSRLLLKSSKKIRLKENKNKLKTIMETMTLNLIKHNLHNISLLKLSNRIILPGK